MKWRPDAPAGMYAAEAAGLRALAEASSVEPGQGTRLRVPEVVVVSDDDAWLLLEYVEQGYRRGRTDETLGRELAQLHESSTRNATFGWSHDNWIGSVPQRNEQNPSWAAFWRDERILPQLGRARSNGYFASARDGGDRMDALLEVLGSLLSDIETPSLLHGDLWGGNAYADSDGRPVLIDPAVYRGDAEVDLAMTELFGGFGPRFYDAYSEIRAISAAYRTYRRDLYQLYYLLVHVNLFGEGYVANSLQAAGRVLSEVG